MFHNITSNNFGGEQIISFNDIKFYVFICATFLYEIPSIKKKKPKTVETLGLLS